jgi:hypothetical protein
MSVFTVSWKTLKAVGGKSYTKKNGISKFPLLRNAGGLLLKIILKIIDYQVITNK